ncbi:MAG: FdtA/QdtA family cupin domain-containing protein [Verrucomicrobiales bacterium]|nr:FdtA/QdtA family cupin domain-containing protein [Verrucomicrobiales bacterium]
MPATDLIHPGETRNCTVQGVQRIILRQHLDERGPLCVLGQGAAALPFVPQRLFFTSGVKGTRRGEHAHRQCAQLLICTSGRLTVLVDDGWCQEEILLCSPQEALLIPPMIWAEQFDHSPGTVLLVLASHAYDAADYLRTRQDWLEALGSQFGI